MIRRIPVYLLIIVLLLLSCLSLTATSVSAASTYYVSPSGSDTAGDGSVLLPWRTITYAVGRASAEDIIKVTSLGTQGTADYQENVRVDKSITIESTTSGGRKPQISASNPAQPVFQVVTDRVTIRGLDIYGASASGSAAICLEGAHLCTIEGNRCGLPAGLVNDSGIIVRSGSDNTIKSNDCSYNNVDGIRIQDSSKNIVDGNTCGSNGRHGISLESSDPNNSLATQNRLVTNTCGNNTSDGICLSYSGSNTIEHNRCSLNSSSGIELVNQSSNNTVTGNTCSSNVRYGVSLTQSSTNTIYLNDFTVSGEGTGANFYSTGSTNVWHSEAARSYIYKGMTYNGMIGNHWSSYGGTDANGDGLGDSPYAVDGEGDTRPLMASTQPHADFNTATITGTEPLEVAFSNLSDSYSGVSAWTWSFGDGQTSNEQNPTHIYAQDGTFTVTLTVAEVDTDTATQAKPNLVTLTDTDPKAIFAASPVNGNVPLKVDFADNSESYDGVAAWKWDFGDGGASDEQNPFHEYEKAGTYTVSLKVTELDGDVATISYNALITVQPAPAASTPINSRVEPMLSRPEPPPQPASVDISSIQDTKSSGSLVQDLAWLWIVVGIVGVLMGTILVDRRLRRKSDFDWDVLLE